MLHQAYRLPAQARLQKPVIYKTPLFLLKVAKNNLPESRFGFIVRKTVDKRAVARNRIRRLFRSCIEDMREQILPGYDMLFFLEKGIMEKKQTILREELETFLREKHLVS